MLISCLFRPARVACALGAASVAILAVLCLLSQAWGRRPNPEMLLRCYKPAMALPLLRCLPEMILGLLAFRLATAPFGSWLARSAGAGLALSGVISVLLTIHEADLAIVVLFPLLILAPTSDDHLPGRLLACQPIEFLGRLSYSVYLTHELMSGFVGQVHATIKALGWAHAETYAAAVGVTFPLACLSYYLIEIPGRRWLRRVFDGGVGRPTMAEPSAL